MPGIMPIYFLNKRMRLLGCMYPVFKLTYAIVNVFKFIYHYGVSTLRKILIIIEMANCLNICCAAFHCTISAKISSTASCIEQSGKSPYIFYRYG